MTDSEITIKCLECCGGYNDELEHVGCTSECPYWESEDCCNSSKPFQDALALLREQEPVKPIERSGFWYCGNCRYALMTNHQKFCSDCGQAVKRK